MTMQSNRIKTPDRRRAGLVHLVERFTLEYAEALAFLGGLTAYPIGLAILSILGAK
jgi:hypothetical protein